MSASSGTDSVVPQQVQEVELDDNEQTIAKDDLFHLLQSCRRRSVLAYLREYNEEVTLGELAEQIAAWENNKTTDELMSNERQNVYISLYQIHLEKLDEHGIIEFNKDRGLVTRAEGAVQLDPYIEAPGDDHPSFQVERQTKTANKTSLINRVFDLILRR